MFTPTAWLAIAGLGSGFGLLLGSLTRPRWDALPDWWAWSRRPLHHALYGIGVFTLFAVLVQAWAVQFPLSEIGVLIAFAAWLSILCGFCGQRSRRAHALASAGTIVALAIALAIVSSLMRAASFP